MNVLQNIDLTDKNSFGLKVKADYFIEYESVEDLKEILSSKQYPAPFNPIGTGSNIVFTKDFKGTLLSSLLKELEIIKEDENEVLLKVGSGLSIDEICEWTAQRGYWGMENLSLIPAVVGAAVIQNIGAYGTEIKDVVYAVQCIDKETLNLREFSLEECGYDYRESNFKTKFKNRYIVISAILKLSKKYKAILEYGDVKTRLIDRYGEDSVINENLTPLQIRQEIVSIRKEKIPAGIKTAGSFFKNPYIDENILYNIRKVAFEKGFGEPPVFEISKELYKIPAAWLLDKAGWKGYTENGVEVNKYQPLVLVNVGENTEPMAVVQMKDKLIQSIKELFEVELCVEVELW